MKIYKTQKEIEVDIEEFCHCSGRLYKEFCIVHRDDCSLAIKRVDKLMPRAGICNKCIGWLGAKHCKGVEIGCDCKCRK